MKKYVCKIIILLFVYGIYMLILKGNTSFAEQIIQDGTYTIKSAVNENYVIDVTGVSKEDCANIELWQCNGGKNQAFYFKHLGDNYYAISAIHSDKYLDVAWASTANGANVEQYTYNGNYNQQWLLKRTEDGYFNIISRCSGLLLDVNNASMYNGSNIITWQSNGGNNQKFRLQPTDVGLVNDGTYMIASALNEKFVFDIQDASTQNLAKLTISECNNENNQKFYIKNIGRGYYTISASHSLKYLDVEGGTKRNGANVIQHPFNNGDNQKWLIKYAGDNFYYIVSKCSGLYLDVCGATVNSGTNIITWVNNGGRNQKFKLIPTTANIEDEGRSAEFKKAHPEIKVGIDVSRYQGVIDWNKVKKDGIDYAMIRAGFRGYGESGSLNEDTMFEQNVKGARAAGLDVGVYFFSQAKNMEEGIKEAEYTISLIRKFDITYPVAFDTEESSSPTNTGRADNISVQDRTDATKGFCSTIENAGYKTLIYANPYWLKNNLDLSQLSQYKIWLANYTGATQEDPLKRPSNYQGDYVMWQYTDSGTVKGIDGSVDCNIYYYLKQD